MKLKLPFALLTAVLACVNLAAAQDTSSLVPGTGDIATPENTYMAEIKGSGGSSLGVNAKNVTWNQSYAFPAGTPISVGSVLTEATLFIVTPEGAEEKTLVCTSANMFIGGWGWGVNSSDGLAPNSGTVYVGKDATLQVGYGTSGTSTNQLNIGSSSNYAETGVEGKMIVDGGTVEAGNPNVGLSWDSKGTLEIRNGGTLTAVNKGNNTGVFAVGYYGNSTGTVIVDESSTIKAEYYTIVGYGRDGEASGDLTVQGGSTAELGSYLFVGRENGSTGEVTVDSSALTAGTTYVGYGAETSGEITARNGSQVELTGNTYLGYNGGDGTMSVSDGSSAHFEGDVYVGYWADASGKLSIDATADAESGSAASVTVDKTLYIGYNSTGVNEVSVTGENSELTVKGDTYVGYAQKGGLTVSDGASANLQDVVVYAGSELKATNGSEVTVAGDLSVTRGSAVTVTDGEDATSSLNVTGSYVNYGTTNVDLSKGGTFTAGGVLNAGTMDIVVDNGGTFQTDAFVNAGDTNITATEGTTCELGTMQLVSGSMKLDGEGSFEMGSAASETMFTVSGSSVAEATSTYIDISTLSSQNFTINDEATYTFHFSDDIKAALVATTHTFMDIELMVIDGYEGFVRDQLQLATMLQNTSYDFSSDVQAAAEESLTDFSKFGFVLTNQRYEMRGDDLVWKASVAVIPEPTTATLSLLALAALAARRRRR